jgi:lipid II:glycine glycyltransferase (peptidoglycan interpeptide bridge formation enzyme)
MHPLLGTWGALLPLRNEAIQTVDHGFTVSIDITLDEQTLDAKVRRDHRRNIRRLVANGFEARVDEWSDYPAFQKIYRDTMTRLGAADDYIFDDRYFSNLRKCLGPSLHICTILNPAGKVVSGGLFSVHGTVSQYHLSGTVEASLSEAPSKLLVREMRNWAKRAGAKVFHLGGGVGAGRDSLFMFKHGFSTDEHKFHTVRVIHDEFMYAELKKRWLVEAVPVC